MIFLHLIEIQTIIIFFLLTKLIKRVEKLEKDKK
jgi:hypothetical protein